MVGGKIGIGIIVQDCDSFVLRGITTCKVEYKNVKWVELCALAEGINLAYTNSFEKVMFEINCASIVNHFRKN